MILCNGRQPSGAGGGPLAEILKNNDTEKFDLSDLNSPIEDKY